MNKSIAFGAYFHECLDSVIHCRVSLEGSFHVRLETSPEQAKEPVGVVSFPVKQRVKLSA